MMNELAESSRQGPLSGTSPYSPLTLNSDWSKTGRLAFILFCICFGTTLNGFFIAAFFVENDIRRIGNVHLCCLGFCDLIITTVVMPVCALVLLSGEWETVELCYFLQTLTDLSIYSYNMLYMLVAVESYYRVIRNVNEDNLFNSIYAFLIISGIFLASLALATIGVYHKLDYDYCERKHHGYLPYRVTTTFFFHFVPCVFTLTTLILTRTLINYRAHNDVQYRRSQQHKTDHDMNKLNLTNYIIFIISWIPYILVIYHNPDVSDGVFYNLIWLALLRSMISPFLYGTMNRYFRRAYAHIFNYCCCKTDLSSSLKTRHRRLTECRAGRGKVKARMIHQVVSSSPQDHLSSYEVTEL